MAIARFLAVGISKWEIKRLMGGPSIVTQVPPTNPQYFEFELEEKDIMDLRYVCEDKGMEYLGTVVDGVLVPSTLPEF